MQANNQVIAGWRNFCDYFAALRLLADFVPVAKKRESKTPGRALRVRGQTAPAGHMYVGCCAECGRPRWARRPDMWDRAARNAELEHRPLAAENWVWTCDTPEHRAAYLRYLGRDATRGRGHVSSGGVADGACRRCGADMPKGNRNYCGRACKAAHRREALAVARLAPLTWPACVECGRIIAGTTLRVKTYVRGELRNVPYCGQKCVARRRARKPEVKHVLKIARALAPPGRAARNCDMCARLYLPTRAAQKYCCDACRMRAAQNQSTAIFAS